MRKERIRCWRRGRVLSSRLGVTGGRRSRFGANGGWCLCPDCIGASFLDESEFAVYGYGGHVNGFRGTGFLDHAREVCFQLCECRYAFLVSRTRSFTDSICSAGTRMCARLVSPPLSVSH